MDILKDIIEQHFISPEKQEILILLKKYDLADLILKHGTLLIEQIQKHLSTNNKAPLPILSSSASNLLVAINSKVTLITDPFEKRKIQQAVANLSVRMFASIIKLFPNDALEVLKAVQEGLQSTSSLWSYDYNDIDQLMHLSGFYEMIQSIDGSNAAKKIKKIEQGPISFLKWTKKCDTGFLTSELKEKGWIKSQNGFVKLFDNQDESLKVHWNTNYRYELARLLFMLHEKDFIRPVPSKGYFAIAERHIVDFAEKPLPKNALKKLSSKMTQEPDKYKEIISEVDELINKLNSR
ncbi:hypothetical protein A3860_02550 [Niastella vici]|uniref:Uncharacterized protein n=1 Tax=Niastella vici TaxID=1703345 RepID=A0A1V9G9M5_9BACT|nr:hypothetical protein [Niastella vici]OQP67260.1 hypothetical protein A3860_02550 [Niastella vici]